MKASLEMRSKNLREALTSTLRNTDSDVIATKFGSGDTEPIITVSMAQKAICHITVHACLADN